MEINLIELSWPHKYFHRWFSDSLKNYFDKVTGIHCEIRLPAPHLSETLIARLLPIIDLIIPDMHQWQESGISLKLPCFMFGHPSCNGIPLLLCLAPAVPIIT